MILTLAIWVIAFFLLYSNVGNRTNRWIAVCFIISSIGSLKEYLIENYVPKLIHRYPDIGPEVYVTIDSCLIAVLYLLIPLCFITMSMYFAGFDRKDKKIIPLVQLFTLTLIVTFIIIYRPVHFKYYQLYRKDFWYVMTAYNIGYCIAGSIIAIRSLKHEFNLQIRRQKRIILKIFLVPYFFWLFTIFIIHTLDIDWLKKVWKGNVFLIIGVLIFYGYMAYKEGFMGLKVSVVKYDWNSQMKSVSSSTQYINHMLKNQANKISWSVDSIRKKLGREHMEELDIIERSAGQLVYFTERTNRCLATKSAGNDLCSAGELISMALEAFKPFKKAYINISAHCREDILIKCDTKEIVEVIYNLVKNSSEAISGNGNITVSGYKIEEGYCIEVRDDGMGIAQEQINQLFVPFYTTKKNNVNFGIGLSYCKSVMQAHGGSIHVHSQKGITRFVLYFPLKRLKKKEAG